MTADLQDPPPHVGNVTPLTRRPPGYGRHGYAGLTET